MEKSKEKKRDCNYTEGFCNFKDQLDRFKFAINQRILQVSETPIGKSTKVVYELQLIRGSCNYQTPIGKSTNV